MNVFITGITGLAGVHLAEHLLASGHSVSGCSRRAQWPRHASFDLTSQVSPQTWDVGEAAPDDLARHLRTFAPDAIVHLAALSVPADCGTEQPTPTARAVNVDGVRHVVELAARLETNPRILLASSCYVYRPVSAAGVRVDEHWPTEPAGAYGKTKFAAEDVLRTACEQEGLAWIIARVFHHTGPGQSPRMMLPHWIQQFVASDADPIQVHSLNSYLDLSDVRDVARAYLALLERAQPGTIYNVGSGQCRRSGDIFEMLRKRYDPARKVVESSPRRRFHPVADIRRISHDTGWKPSIPLENTIEDTWSFWKREMRL